MSEIEKPDAETTRQRILEAAEEVFADKGFNQATVRDILKRAGVGNIAAINYHFGDKERLYIETVKNAHSCCNAEEFPAWPEGTPPEQKLRDFISVLAERMLSPQRLTAIKVLMREMADPTNAAEEVVREYIKPMADLLQQILSELYPMFPPERIYLIGNSVVGQCLFYRQNRPIIERLMGKETLDRLTPEVLAQHVTDIMFGSLGGKTKPLSGKPKGAGVGGKIMNWVALKMLMGDRTKYLGIVFGIAFATLLMGQQISIFTGIMSRTASQIKDVRDADIWVMDKNTRFIDEVPPLPETDLQRVRGVPGVAWAVKMYKGQVTARLDNGQFRSVILFGLDDNSLVGAPRDMILGSPDDLRQPDAVILDKAGYQYMWPGQPLAVGRTIEMNDRRAVVVGICKVSPPFTTLPVLYTRYSQAEWFVPHSRNLMSFILAKPQADVPAEVVCQRIEERTRENNRQLAALTQQQFFWKTIKYFLGSTGIPVNFGITIVLGFVVGLAIAGQTFYLFTVENLRQFGSLKAMGVCNTRILGMILLQALVVGLIGYGIGCGLTATFFEGTSHVTHLAGLGMYPEVMLGVGGAVLFIVLLASVVSARRVLLLEPAVVFRG